MKYKNTEKQKKYYTKYYIISILVTIVPILEK